VRKHSILACFARVCYTRRMPEGTLWSDRPWHPFVLVQAISTTKFFKSCRLLYYEIRAPKIDNFLIPENIEALA
jgi:hypothetical protein